MRNLVNDLVFIPTKLLNDLTTKIFKSVEKMRDLMYLNDNDFQRTKDELKEKNEQEDSFAYPMEEIIDTFIPICRDLGVPLDTVLKGEVKAVKRKGAQMLLNFYKIDIYLEKIFEKNEIVDLSEFGEVAEMKTA